MKKVVIGEELDIIIKKSLDILCDTVGSTLGPKGNNSIISSSSLPAFVTDDGVTLARNIESDDACVNSILEILKEASIRTDEIVGDGTTTTLVLLKAIMSNANDLIHCGMSRYEVKKELENEEKMIEDLIIKESFKPDDNALKNIATTSSKSEKIGETIYQVVKKIRNIAGVTITTSNKEETCVKYFKGYEFDTNLASPFFFKGTSSIKLKNPYVLVTSESIYDIEKLSNLINKSFVDKRNLLIFAADYDEDVINQVLSFNYDNDLKIYLLKNPEFGKRQYLLMSDLLEICNCKEYKNQFSYDNVGVVKEIVINKDKTYVYFDNNLADYIEENKSNLEYINDEFDINYYERRISMLSDGLATIEVGGKTISEARENKMHYDDAIHATYSALEGVNIGAGYTYLKISSILEDNCILKNALCVPFRQILKNAGLDVNTIEKNVTFDFKKIYNVKVDDYEGIDSPSVLDSTKVLIQSLKTAVSIANILLSTGSLIINEQIKNIDIDHDINI